MLKRDLHFEEFYPQTVEKVWAAVTDSRSLAEWLMPNDFEPRLGHRFTFRTDPKPGFDGIVHCEVTALDPPRRLMFTWVGGPLETALTITLEAAPGGTRLTLDHTGFTGVHAVAVSYILGSGWPGMLRKKLREVLDRRAAGPTVS